MRCQPEHGLTIFKRQTRGVEIMKFKLLVLIAVVMFNVVPVWAQANPVHTVGMDGVSFSFDAAIAQNVNIVAFAGDPVDLQAPGGPQAPYTEFVLYNGTPAPESAFDAAGGVRIYRTADLAAYPEHQNRLIALQNLLAARPDLAQYMVAQQNMNDVTLPYLPVYPAVQVIRAQAQYIDTGMVSGIRFLTTYAQGPMPLLSNSVFYTFQGISTDGTRYVSVMFKLNASMFPAEVPADFNSDAFYADPLSYFNQDIATLNAAAPGAFAPSLTTLDAVVQSLAIGG
jgi:hypothetical protein